MLSQVKHLKPVAYRGYVCKVMVKNTKVDMGRNRSHDLNWPHLNCVFVLPRRPPADTASTICVINIKIADEQG
jgi:hypothetical protein